MVSTDLKFGIIFLFQIVIGTLGNFFLLHYYFSLYFSGCRSRFVDAVLRHLMVANIVVILSRGIPDTVAAFGMKDFLSDFGCKLVFYLHRVGRGVSLDTTCLLSVLQAITISPRGSVWAELKGRAWEYLGSSAVLFWVLHVLLNIQISMCITGKGNSKNFSRAIEFQYCSVLVPEKDIDKFVATCALSHDILCLKLMVWASSSIVFILYRHKQRVSHICSHNVSWRSSPETRVSLSTLLLVFTFMFSYTFASAVHVLLSFYDKSATRLVTTAALINTCFPTLSPFILLSRERGVSTFIWKK
ncbi:vomeronasal type-1 receptor 2-like [Ctenodactylus gundi]